MHLIPTCREFPTVRYFGSYLFSHEEAEIVLVSVPWDVTTSYRDGTRMGPEAIMRRFRSNRLIQCQGERSLNIPHCHWKNTKNCPFWTGRPESWHKDNPKLGRRDRPREKRTGRSPDQVNSACARMNRIVYLQCSEQLRAGKFVGLVEENILSRWVTFRHWGNITDLLEYCILMLTPIFVKLMKDSRIHMPPLCIMPWSPFRR